MHVLATRPGGYAAGDGVVDLGQTPADIVFLSAADTELALVAEAADAMPADFPSLRIASLLALRSHGSVDLYFDSVLAHARVVVASVIGGVSYFEYGIERLVERARDGGLTLILVPGDDMPDASLTRLGSVPEEEAAQIWRYLREGGPSNARALLSYLGARYFERGALPAQADVLPRVAHFDPKAGALSLDEFTPKGDRPVAALLFYRAHLQAGNLAAFSALMAALEREGLEPLAISVASLKDASCRAEVVRALAKSDARIVLNTTGFAISSGERDAHEGTLGRDVPVLQVIMSGGNVEDWQREPTGLSARDLAMSVVLPEVDGRIITRAVSFKGLSRRSERTEADVAAYHVEPGRAAFVAELAARWVRLANTQRAERSIALVLANYPNRDGRLGNGVGLDTPASTVEILHALAAAGYDVQNPPRDGEALMARLLDRVTNDLDVIDTRVAEQSLSLSDYRDFLSTLPRELVARIDARWGLPERDPRVRGDRIVVSGIRLGKLFVGIQPARGYGVDVTSTYHDPDLPPPHGYVAFYAWLRTAFRAHAIVHVGKHGSLEWLPGKSVALSDACFPDALIGPMPHLYPFIVNDPGEGSQAKRRTQAVIIDHLVPPLTRAESYGVLRDLEKLVDEYYQALVLDPARSQLLRREILRLAKQAGLDRELGLDAKADEDRWLVSLDAYLCDLKESQIRDGLHVFGRSPRGAQRLDTLVALARLPAGRGQGRDDSLIRALSKSLLGDFDPLDAEFSAPWQGPRPALLEALSDEPWRTAGDTRERLELCARRALEGALRVPDAVLPVLERIERDVAPRLDASGPCELAGLLRGLDGRFVPPGPSGAPTRGRIEVLPTGKNFYSVDVRAVPTPSAFRLAERAAERLVLRYVQDHGEYPRTLALSLWGTATMRTGGDDVAQALCLLGARPVWAEGSGRVTDTEILPASALRRPRVDVVLRISGFFRDAFPDLVRLLDSAIRAVAELDEPPDVNPLRARVQADEITLIGEGLDEREAQKRARYRIFGAKPGAYGAGVQALLDQGAWQARTEIGAAYLAHSGYAYTAIDVGEAAEPALKANLSRVDAVLHNQDNREHDVLDSADYFEYQGGLSAAVELSRGSQPALYHGDHQNPEAPRIRSLREEVARVVRSRVVNPKWLAAARRHGYKGALEMAATVDFLFGYGATTGVVEDHQYALVSDAFLLDGENREFLARHNAHALREMTERMLEAMQRGLWQEPGEHRAALEDLLVDAEEGSA